jgi:hypothetical protein
VKTTIEINGRTYDALTGKILSSTGKDTSSAKPVRPTHHKAPAAPLRRGVIMDGVARRPAHATTRQPAHKTSVPAAPATQKSQTLHRKAVKKPGNTKPVPYVHSTSANMQSRVEQSATGRGLLLKRVPDVRLSRALTSHKSGLVSKFGKATVNKPQLTSELVVQTAPVSVTASKTDAPAAPPPIQPAHSKHTTSQESSKKFVFEDHIKQANSHLLKPLKKESRRKRLLKSIRVSPKVLSAAAGVFAIVLLAGFFAYQNIPAVSMRVAANTAGFEGKLPKSIPAGYSFNGPVQAAPDNISLTYESNSDARRFIVTQKPTNWSSEGLLTNYLVDSQFRYQVYKDKGLTVYIYNGSNATWVDKGVWFSVNGEEGSLSSEQLLELAASI